MIIEKLLGKKILDDGNISPSIIIHCPFSVFIISFQRLPLSTPGVSKLFELEGHKQTKCYLAGAK